MTVFGYCRVSTTEQTESGSSLATQSSQITGYCLMKGWTEPPTMLVEGGVSGSVPLAERPIGSELLSVVKKGDQIVITKLDRGFRNCADAIATLDRLGKVGASLHLIDMGGDVGRDGVSRMVFQILSAVAEMERSRIRERIREVKQHMKLAGKHHGGPRPFGFEVVEGRQVSLPDEQAAIERMHVLRNERLSCAAIAQEIREAHGYDLWPKQVARILSRGQEMTA